MKRLLLATLTVALATVSIKAQEKFPWQTHNCRAQNVWKTCWAC